MLKAVAPRLDTTRPRGPGVQSCVGLAVALDAAARRPSWRWLTPVVLGLTLVAVVCVGGLTGRQARVWRDTTSLWAQAVRATGLAAPEGDSS
jgi:hypothetical protein